jgi:hypothetical protein
MILVFCSLHGYCLLPRGAGQVVWNSLANFGDLFNF